MTPRQELPELDPETLEPENDADDLGEVSDENEEEENKEESQDSLPEPSLPLPDSQPVFPEENLVQDSQPVTPTDRILHGVASTPENMDQGAPALASPAPAAATQVIQIDDTPCKVEPTESPQRQALEDPATSAAGVSGVSEVPASDSKDKALGSYEDPGKEGDGDQPKAPNERLQRIAEIQKSLAEAKKRMTSMILSLGSNHCFLFLSSISCFFCSPFSLGNLSPNPRVLRKAKESVAKDSAIPVVESLAFAADDVDTQDHPFIADLAKGYDYPEEKCKLDDLPPVPLVARLCWHPWFWNLLDSPWPE